MPPLLNKALQTPPSSPEVVRSVVCQPRRSRTGSASLLSPQVASHKSPRLAPIPRSPSSAHSVGRKTVVQRSASVATNFNVTPTTTSTTSSSNSNPIKSLEQKLWQHMQVKGPSHPTVGALWNQLGNAHFRLQNNSAAERAYRKASQCDPGPHVAAAWSNLGTVYWSGQQFEQAKQALQHALALYKADDKINEASLAIANVHHQLGLCFALQKDQACIAHLRKAQMMRAALAGPRHSSVAKTLDALGKAHLLLDKSRDAVQCHQEALTIVLQTPNADPRDTYSNLAAALVAGGDDEAAVPVYQKLLAWQRRLNDDGGAGATETLQLLTRSYERTKQYDLATRLRQEVAIGMPSLANKTVVASSSPQLPLSPLTPS